MVLGRCGSKLKIWSRTSCRSRDRKHLIEIGRGILVSDFYRLTPKEIFDPIFLGKGKSPL